MDPHESSRIFPGLKLVHVIPIFHIQGAVELGPCFWEQRRPGSLRKLCILQAILCSCLLRVYLDINGKSSTNQPISILYRLYYTLFSVQSKARA